MRLLYTSPRHDNIERVCMLMTEHGIATRIVDRSNWNRPAYRRFSYQSRHGQRDSWPQVWVLHAEDYTRSRALLSTLGIESKGFFADDLERACDPVMQRQYVSVRARRIVLLAVAATLLMVILRYLHGTR